MQASSRPPMSATEGACRLSRIADATSNGRPAARTLLGEHEEPDRIAVAENRTASTSPKIRGRRSGTSSRPLRSSPPGSGRSTPSSTRRRSSPPQSRPRSPSAWASEALGHDRYRDYFALTRRFENTGKTEVDLAADGFNIWGERYARRQVGMMSIKPNIRRFDATIPILSRHVIAAFAELRDASVGGRRGTTSSSNPERPIASRACTRLSAAATTSSRPR